MAHGAWEGKGLADPAVRALFTRESLIESDWYRERLETRQKRDVALWTRHVRALEAFRPKARLSPDLDVEGRLQFAQARLEEVRGESYRKALEGTIGTDVRLGRPVGRGGA
jgi:hypothetical protein